MSELEGRAGRWARISRATASIVFDLCTMLNCEPGEVVAAITNLSKERVYWRNAAHEEQIIIDSVLDILPGVASIAEAVKRVQELKADAKLGALVRKMPVGSSLLHTKKMSVVGDPSHWVDLWVYSDDYQPLGRACVTIDEALAGVEGAGDE